MNRSYKFLAGGAAVAILLASCAAQSGASAPANKGAEATSKTLTAIKVDGTNLDATAAYWTNAPVTSSPTVASQKGHADGPEVKIQAVYDDKNLAMRIEWSDSSENVYHRAWSWDGSKFTRSDVQQDRMALLFPIENNAKFAAKGCGVACHNNDDDNKKWWMGSEAADQRYDLWQWTAANSNPNGQAQDQWMGQQEDPANHESALHGDKLTSGGSLSNINKAKDGPIFMSSVDLSARYIMTGEQIALDTTKLSKDTLIPASVLAPWVGSRGDIQAQGTWKDGKWTVVLLRALNTGNDEDLAFTPPKSYPFGIALFDHIDQLDHTVTPQVLVLEWK